MDKAYPKYQYSVFLKNGRDEQLVIRTETIEDLFEAKKNIDKILEKAEAKQEVTQTPTTQAEPPVCVTCGAVGEYRTGIGKNNGKPWRAIFCSTKNNSHTKFL